MLLDASGLLASSGGGGGGRDWRWEVSRAARVPSRSTPKAVKRARISATSVTWQRRYNRKPKHRLHSGEEY